MKNIDITPTDGTVSTWILTVPHGRFAEPTARYPRHPCDYVALDAARHLAGTLRTTYGQNVVLIEGQTARAEGDLNRRPGYNECQDGDPACFAREAAKWRWWHDQWKNAVRAAPHPCLLDIHSYDEYNHFASPYRETHLTVLGPPHEMAYDWTQKLSYRVPACNWIRGSAVNYISMFARHNLRCPSVIVEFWEGLGEHLHTTVDHVAQAVVQMSKAGEIHH